MAPVNALEEYSRNRDAIVCDPVNETRDLAAIGTLEAERDALLKAGNKLFERYTGLVDSGDAGFWDWREEGECRDWIALQPREGCEG